MPFASFNVPTFNFYLEKSSLKGKEETRSRKQEAESTLQIRLKRRLFFSFGDTITRTVYTFIKSKRESKKKKKSQIRSVKIVE